MSEVPEVAEVPDVPEVLKDERGPAARLRALKKDEGAAREILALVQRGLTLPRIAKEWGLPERDFLFYVAANGELSEECRRVRELVGVDLRLEGLEIVDGATPETVGVAKLRSEYRKDLSIAMNKPLFGPTLKVERSVSVTVDAGLLGFASELLLRKSNRIPVTIEAEPAQEVGAPKTRDFI